MRRAWTINPIPAKQQSHYPPPPNPLPIQLPLQNLGKPPDEYIANELGGKHPYWTQNVYFNRNASAATDVIKSSHHNQSHMVNAYRI